MSLRISGLLTPAAAAARKPQPTPERPGQPPATDGPEAPESTAARAPASLPVTDTWEPSGEPLPGAPPAPDASEASVALTAALRAADQVRRDAVEAPARAARAHANLVPATVLNLLA